MAKLKITQTKSLIHQDKGQRATIAALGLRKINHSVVKEVNPQIMGMVDKVRHLITIEEVEA